MRKAARAIILKDKNILLTYRNKFGKEYYILPGGGVDMGETPEQALFRELAEETCVTVRNPRLVFMENAGEPYGVQYVYACEYVNGKPALRPDSTEAKINAMGKNLYDPRWVPLAQLAEVEFVSKRLQRALVRALPDNLPKQVVDITES